MSRDTAATFFFVLLMYLLVCGIFAMRPFGPSGTSSGSNTFIFNGSSMEALLVEAAEYLGKEYGSDITVDVEDLTLSYTLSYPTPHGYGETAGTIALTETVKYGDRACTLTSNQVLKERPSSFLMAPVHFLVHRTGKNPSGDMDNDLRNKLRSLAGKSNEDDGL